MPDPRGGNDATADRSDLVERHCEPCRGGVPPLTEAQRTTLLAQVPEWTMQDGVRIERRIACRNFAEALAAVNGIGALSEAERHHPDLSFGWGYVVVSLQTKAIKGLHANDFILAAKIDQFLSRSVGARSS